MLSRQKEAQLQSTADAFRNAKSFERQRIKVEGQLYAARRILVDLDAKDGTAFHALHVIPANLKETLPYPMMSRMFPELAEQVDEEGSKVLRSAADLNPVMGRSLSGNKTQAEKIKEMMKRDMLGDIEEEESLSDGIHAAKRARTDGPESDAATEEDPELSTDFWNAQMEGVKRVLSMSVSRRRQRQLDPSDQLHDTPRSRKSSSPLSSLNSARTTITASGAQRSTAVQQRWTAKCKASPAAPARKKMIINSREIVVTSMSGHS